MVVAYVLMSLLDRHVWELSSGGCIPRRARPPFSLCLTHRDTLPAVRLPPLTPARRAYPRRA
jgi:hypothetical protein